MRHALLLAALAAAAAAPAAAEFRLTILHTNDVHSRIQPINRFDSTCSAEDDAAGECFGGVARIKSALDARRAALDAAGEAHLTLDAGDQFQGSLFYTTYKGQAAAQFVNALGYQAMAVGNHEFDDGPEALSIFLDATRLPVLSGNVDASGDELLADRIPGYTVLEAGGERIAVVSVVAEDTDLTSSPGPTIAFTDPVAYLQGVVPEIEAQGIDKIIALTHVGLPVDRRIAAEVPGLDLIVGGHSHTLLSNDAEDAEGPYPVRVANPEGGETPIVQAYAYSKYLGEIAVTFDDAGRVISAEGEPILLDASVTPDPEIAARVATLAEPIAALMEEVVGRTTDAIDGERGACRSGECAMGVLVTDAMLAASDADIAIQNGGGLRASIDAGPVTMGEVLTVLPFQNTLATFTLSGADVLAALENGVSQVEDGAGRFPQVGGMRYAWDPSAPPGARIVSAETRADGGWIPLSPDTEYRVVSNNFMRRGGDGYSVFAENATNVYDFGPGLEQVVVDYIDANSPYNPRTEGRVTAVSAASDAAPEVGAAGAEHVVARGESLWSIAEDRLGDGARWTELAERNGLTAPYRLAIGQRLALP